MTPEQAKEKPGIRYGWHDRYRIPLDHPAALRFYLEHLMIPHSRREMISATVTRASSLAGGMALPFLGVHVSGRRPGSAPGPRPDAELPADFQTDAELETLKGALGKQLLDARVAKKGALAAITLDDYFHSRRQKMVLFLFDEGAKRPCAVAKVSGDAAHRDALAREFQTARALREKVSPRLRATMPEPVAFAEHGGLTTLAETFLPGRSMYFEMRNSWFPRRLAADHFRAAGRWLAEFHEETRSGEVLFGGGALDEYVAGPLVKYQRLCSPTPEERKFIAEVMRAARAMKAERLPLAAGQGDFWARNLLVSGDGLGVVDWENYRESGPPFSDLFLFATSYGLSYPWRLGRWAEPTIAFRATYFETSWLARLVRKNFRGFCKEVGVSPKLLDVLFPSFLAERALDECNRRGRNNPAGLVPPPSGRATAAKKGRGAGGEPAWEGTWVRLFREYARREGRACFGS